MCASISAAHTIIMKTQPTETKISRLFFSKSAFSGNFFVTSGVVSLKTDTKIEKNY